MRNKKRYKQPLKIELEGDSFLFISKISNFFPLKKQVSIVRSSHHHHDETSWHTIFGIIAYGL